MVESTKMETADSLLSSVSSLGGHGDDPGARLIGLRALPSRKIVGLMSGTSGDGVDAAVVEVTGHGEATKANLISFVCHPYSPEFRRRLLGLDQAPAHELTRIHFHLGERFAQAALDAISSARLKPNEVHLVASHGHTVCHQPRSQGGSGATLQIGESSIIAEQTGLPVISDFRNRDMAAGGEGAPLVPLVDWMLFRASGHVRALQNIGGIANVTLVTEARDKVIAFDNAPGNMILDTVARAATNGAASYDRNGEAAARGRIDTDLLRSLLRHPYLQHSPPKSTGRESFGLPFLRPLLAAFNPRLDDLQATLTRFVAEAIAQSYERFGDVNAPVDEVYVSGGGVHNQTLMSHLRELFHPVPVHSVSALGCEPDAKEALAFAVLGNETLFGQSANMPSATGANGPRVLGKITL